MSSTNTHVYVLSLISVSHSLNYIPEHEIVGVYTSKAAAADAAGSVGTDYGDFNDAIEEMFEEDHIDNRENPPDKGCLLQIGSADTGEGDYVKLIIEKFPLEGATTTSATIQATARSSSTASSKKSSAENKRTINAPDALLLAPQEPSAYGDGLPSAAFPASGNHAASSLYPVPQTGFNSLLRMTGSGVGDVPSAPPYRTSSLVRDPQLAMLELLRKQQLLMNASASGSMNPLLALEGPTAPAVAPTTNSPALFTARPLASQPGVAAAVRPSKKQKVETKESSSRAIDEASLMVIMKDIMEPAEYMRLDEKMKRMVETMESEAAPLRSTRDHKFGLNVEPENLFKEHPGDFWGMFETRDYMRARVALANTIYEEIASVYGTQVSWETALWHYQELLRLCSSDNLGIRYTFPFLLLRLDRDDDAFCFIRNWVSPEDNDSDIDDDDGYSAREKLHHASKEGDWLYGHEKDSRYLDIFREVSTNEFKYGGLAFLVALACIKMRIIAAEHKSKPQQRTQLDQIFNLIQTLNPVMLPALLHPEPLLSKPAPEYTSDGSPSECYSIVKDASSIWHKIPGALKVLQDRFGKKPSYNTIMNIY